MYVGYEERRCRREARMYTSAEMHFITERGEEVKSLNSGRLLARRIRRFIYYIFFGRGFLGATLVKKRSKVEQTLLLSVQTLLYPYYMQQSHVHTKTTSTQPSRTSFATTCFPIFTFFSFFLFFSLMARRTQISHFTTLAIKLQVKYLFPVLPGCRGEETTTRREMRLLGSATSRRRRMRSLSHIGHRDPLKPKVRLYCCIIYVKLSINL